MYRKLLFITTALFYFFQAQAQRTQVFSDPTAYYNRALELYDKEKYSAAVKEFRDYLEKGKELELQINSKFYLAFCALHLGHDDAEEQMLELLDRHQNHPQSNMGSFLLARHYYKSNNFSKAIDYFEKTDPMDLKESYRWDYYFSLGYAYFTKEKYAEASTQFNKIKLNKDKYYYPTNYYLGYIAMQEEKWDEALAYFENTKTSKIYSEKIPIYITRIYYKKGEYQKLLDYSENISGNPEQNNINWERGKALFQLKRYDEAASMLGPAIKDREEIKAEDRYMTGMAYYLSKDYENAYLHFTAIAKNSEELKQSALMYAADCFLKLDKKNNARNAFYEASRLDTDKELQEQALFNYAKLSFELSFHQVAISSFQNFIETYPRSPLLDDAKGLLGETFLSTKKYRDAIPVIESINNKSEKVKKVYQEICFYYANELMSDKPEDAEIYFKKSKKYPINKSIDAQIDFWLGEIAFAQNDFKEAENYSRSFVNAPDASSTAVYNNGLYNLGYSLFKQKEYGKASVQFKKYVDRETYSGDNTQKKRYIDGITRLGDCYFTEGDYSKAIDAYSYVTSKEAPNSDYAMYQMGIIYGLSGKYEEKIQTLRKIPAKYPTSVYVDAAFFEVAMVHMQRQYYEEAIRGFSYLLQDNPNNVYAKKCYLNRGLARYNLKQTEAALEDFKTVVEDFNKSDETEAAINAITAIYTESGQAEELLTYLKTKAGKTLSISYEDSLTYIGAYNYLYKGSGEKDYKGGLSKFKSYINKFPNGYYITEATFYKAVCEDVLGNYEEALKDYLYVVSRNNPQFNEHAHLRAAVIYLSQNKYAEALPLLQNLERIAAKKENQTYAQVNLMKANYELENFEDAQKAAQKVLKNEQINKEDRVLANLIVGRVYMQKEEWKQAQAYFEKVSKGKENINSKGAEAAFNLALIQFKLGNIKEAQDLIFKLDDKYANQVYWVAKGFVLLGETYLAQDDKFQARATLQSIVDNYDNEDDGIKEEAAKLLEKAVE